MDYENGATSRIRSSDPWANSSKEMDSENGVEPQ
jgi:hypothetical protein